MSGIKIGKASPSLVKYRGDQANKSLLPALWAEKLGGKGGVQRFSGKKKPSPWLSPTQQQP